MREIVLDTETTGFEPNDGDRIVEIGAVELFNHSQAAADVARFDSVLGVDMPRAVALRQPGRQRGLLEILFDFLPAWVEPALVSNILGIQLRPRPLAAG